MPRGLSRITRTPREATRDRRNTQRFGGAMSLMFSGALSISDEGLIVLNLQTNSGLDQDTTGLTVVVQDVLAIDASGVKLNFGSGLYSDSGTLKIELDSPSGLDFSANRLTVVVQGVIDFDASGIKLTHGTGLQDDGGTLKTADGQIVHNDLSGYVAAEHIDWTGTTENLLTTGNITIDSDASGLIFGDAQDATLKWDDGTGVVTLSTGLTIDSDITISSGSIVSASGTISVGDDNIVTTGMVGIGTASPGIRLDIVGDSTNKPYARMTRYSTDSSPTILYGRKSRGTEGSPVSVVDGDVIFKFLAYGMKGGTFKYMGEVTCAVDGTPAAGGTYRVPSKWYFFTVEDGDTANTHKRLEITNDGIIDCQSGQILTAGTHVGTPDEITATSGGVAASVTTLNTEVTTNGDSDLDNVTLANGISGQVKHIYCVAEGNAADTWKITPANMVGGTEITFAGVGEGCTLVYADNEGWVVVANNGGTIT